MKAGIMVLASGMRGKSSCATGANNLIGAVLADPWIGSAEDRLWQLTWNSESLELPVRVRYGGETMVILLHGIGCSRESFDDAFTSVGLQGYSICAFDFPGHGDAAHLISSRRLRDSTDFLRSYADLTCEVVDRIKNDRPEISRVIIVGHSMGGAVGVIAASVSSDIDGLVNIDGNLVAEDCGIVSRGMAAQSLNKFLRAGFPEFLRDLRQSSGADLKAWARWWAMANPTAVHRAAQSLVQWSDSGKLLEMFNKIPSRAYMYGATDDREYIVKQIGWARIPVSGVGGAGHFAMIDNAVEFYRALSAALTDMRR